MKTITFIGHVAVDVIVDGEKKVVPGGGVFYGADAVRAITDNVKVNVLTKMAPKDKHLFEELADRDITLSVIDSENSTTFENIYPDSNPDHRISHCHKRADPWCKKDLSTASHDCVIISALWTQEFPEELIEDIRALTDFLVVDVQGFTRFVTKDLSIEQHDWKSKEKYFKFFDLIKTDAKEATMLTGEEDMYRALDSLIRMCRDGGLIVCTHKEGIILKSKNKVYESRFGKYGIEGRTGRGDTVTAILATLLIHGVDPQKALDTTAEIVTIKMQHSGSLRKEFLTKRIDFI